MRKDEDVRKNTGLRIRTGLALLTVLFAAGARAQVPRLLHEVFQDHAVLQRDEPIAIWGEAPAGEPIVVSLGEATARVQTDAAGRWRATLPPLSAGGPFVLTARTGSGASQTAEDVLVGDVFLCSGQSNMELPVIRASDSQNEVNTSANNGIRMLTVSHADSPTPLLHFKNPVAWQIAGPDTVGDWSAACFFFARELQKTVHIPIGLVHSSWGGSNIRPWMSASALHVEAEYESGLKILAQYATSQAAAQNEFADRWQEWWRGKSGDRMGTEPWSVKPASSSARGPSGSSEANWRTAPAGLGDWRDWSVPELKDFTGLVWFRTTFTLTAAQAKSAATLSLGSINQVDETWINGRAIGNTFGYGTDRAYPLAPGTLHAGENILVVNVLSTYGGGGFRNGGAERALTFPDGNSVPLDGAWQYRRVPPAFGYPPRAPWESVGGLTTLYNAMIAPLGAFGLRGALWYQGESNTGEAGTYRSLLAGLMADWRHQFDAQLPFLIVQLPNYGAPPVKPGESGWADVREAERRAAAADPHAGLAVTIDIGDAHNLHPTNKQDVGRRLARAARHVIYGETLSSSGPVPLRATRAGAQVAVEFGDVERGLVAYSHDTPIGFELCGDAAGTCRFAESHIEGARVLLEIADAAPPTRVRYCWADSPVCTLFDLSGLPAGPFELKIYQ